MFIGLFLLWEECGKTRSVENAECGKRGVWKTQSVENADCGKRGVWKTRSVENVVCELEKLTRMDENVLHGKGSLVDYTQLDTIDSGVLDEWRHLAGTMRKNSCN